MTGSCLEKYTTNVVHFKGVPEYTIDVIAADFDAVLDKLEGMINSSSKRNGNF